jgi:AraC-like DNA-binding protein
MRASSRRMKLTLPAGSRLADAATFSRLCRARDYLAGSYRERVTLQDVAREACLSPFHFNRLFTQTFGETPHEFRTRMRIEEAKKLLLADGHSVTDICFEVGYESLGSFSMRFRSLAGTSPQAFRREARTTFAGLSVNWPLYFIPACFQQFFVNPL